jgi:Fe(3+) dicitrate transport protein
MHRFLRFAFVTSTSLFALRAAAQESDPSSPIGVQPESDRPKPREATAPKEPRSTPEDPIDVNVAVTREAETGGSVHTIKRKALERFEYDDPQQILLAVPGVYARGEDGLGLRPNIGIRGGNSDRSKKLTLLEDGVLFGPAPYSAPAAYYFPLMTRMRGVRVLKGPSAIVYGPQTVGGAIELLTEEVPAATAGSVDAAGGQFGYRKLHARAGTSSGDLGFLVEGVHLANTGFKDLDRGGDTGFVRNEWMAKASWQLPGSARVQQDLALKLGYSDERSNETYLGLTDADFRATPYRRYLASRLDRMVWHRTSVVATHHAVFPLSRGELDVTTSAYRHDLARIWRKVNGVRGAILADVLADPSSGRNALWYGLLTGTRDSGGPAEAILIGPNNRTFVSQGVQTVARLRTTGDGWENRLEWGLRVHYDHIRRVHTEDAFLVQGGELVQDTRPTATTVDNFASTTAIALHAADAFSWNRLVVTPGVRMEILRSRFENNLGQPEETGPRSASVGTMAIVLPGIGAYYGITSELGLVGGVHRGFSPPPPGGRPAPGAATPKPEDSINYEGGARFTGKRLRAEVLGFFNDYRNLTDVCTFSNGCVGENIDRQFDAGAVHVYGAEGFVETEIRATKELVVPLRLAYTFTRTRFLSTFPSQDPQFGDVVEGDELPYVPRHQLSTVVGVETKRWGLSAQTSYVGRMRESASQGPYEDGATTDAYLIVDASGYLRVNSWLRIYLNGRNLGDTAYLVSRRPFGARPGAPRWFQAGVKIDF